MGELEEVIESIRRHWGKSPTLEALIVDVYNDTKVNPREIPKVIAVIQSQLSREKI